MGECGLGLCRGKCGWGLCIVSMAGACEGVSITGACRGECGWILGWWRGM